MSCVPVNDSEVCEEQTALSVSHTEEFQLET